MDSHPNSEPEKKLHCNICYNSSIAGDTIFVLPPCRVRGHAICVTCATSIASSLEAQERRCPFCRTEDTINMTVSHSWQPDSGLGTTHAFFLQLVMKEMRKKWRNDLKLKNNEIREIENESIERIETLMRDKDALVKDLMECRAQILLVKNRCEQTDAVEAENRRLRSQVEATASALRTSRDEVAKLQKRVKEVLEDTKPHLFSLYQAKIRENLEAKATISRLKAELHKTSQALSEVEQSTRINDVTGCVTRLMRHLESAGTAIEIYKGIRGPEDPALPPSDCTIPDSTLKISELQLLLVRACGTFIITIEEAAAEIDSYLSDFIMEEPDLEHRLKDLTSFVDGSLSSALRKARKFAKATHKQVWVSTED